MRHIVEKTGSLFPEFPLFVLLKQNFVDWRHAGKESGDKKCYHLCSRKRLVLWEMLCI